MPIVTFSAMTIGAEYSRNQLTELWGYEKTSAIGRGIFTPREQNVIVLFITKKQQPSLPQYNNRFDGELLWMDGENAHRSDQRLANSNGRDEIHLLYRERDHTPFRYCGPVSLVECFINTDGPSRFIFTSRAALIAEAEAAMYNAIDTPGEPFTPQNEGQRKERLHYIYERSKKNRDRALEIHGCSCLACGFNFDAIYGTELSRSYIEVHHRQSLTTINGQTVNPETDLAPLCANCHRMAHRRCGTIVSVEDLRMHIEQQKGLADILG
jgi:5-methylcytosine-specific restriction protein A